MPTEYDYDKENEEIEEFHTTDLKQLTLLVPESDYNRIMSLKGDEKLTREVLCECGDILITNLRAFC